MAIIGVLPIGRYLGLVCHTLKLGDLGTYLFIIIGTYLASKALGRLGTYLGRNMTGLIFNILVHELV